MDGFDVTLNTMLQTLTIDGSPDVERDQALPGLFRLSGVKQDANVIFHFPLLLCVYEFCCIRHQKFDLLKSFV